MASFNYYLKDATSKEEQPIYLRYNDRGLVNLKFYIRKSIKPKFWDSGDQKARRNFDGYADFNSILTERKSQLEQLCRQLEATNGKIDTEILKARFNAILGRDAGEEKKDFKTLSDFAKHYIESVKSAKAANTILHNNQTLNLLTSFETAKRKKITFDRVNLDFYNDFIEFLTAKNYSPNTIGKHIANIKLFLNEATERGFNTKFDYKSKRFKTTSETVESIYLSEAELMKIYNHDFSNHRKLEHTRDLFIVGCWTGLRFSDFSQLTQDNIVLIEGKEYFKVKTIKTGDTVVIPLHWMVKEVLQKYAHTAKGLPRPYSNQKMNEYLKDVGEKVEIDETILHTHTKGGLKVQTSTPKFKLMTTHTARRSFATNLFLSGFPAISIMKITGHKTEKSFMKYIKISQEENAKLLQLHWSANTKLKAV